MHRFNSPVQFLDIACPVKRCHQSQREIVKTPDKDRIVRIQSFKAARMENKRFLEILYVPEPLEQGSHDRGKVECPHRSVAVNNRCQIHGLLSRISGILEVKNFTRSLKLLQQTDRDCLKQV